MPNREDETWAGQKDDLCYCYTHKRYYDEKVGCQRCYTDHLNLKIAIDAIPQAPELKHCPQCKRESLFWNKYARQFECLDLSCKKTYTKEEYEAATALRLDETLKCLRCGQTSVVWNRPFVCYECKSCHKTFSREEVTAALATDAEEKRVQSEPREEEHPKEQVEEAVKEVVPYQMAPGTPVQSQTPAPLQVCPSCKERSLVPNRAGNGYECLKCRETFFKASVDRFNEQTEAAKKALDALKEKETKGWFGYQYYDGKRKRWRDGQRPRRVGNNWLWNVILIIVIIVIAALILSHFYPDSRFAIFVW
jgi:transposase-like protein